jgi:transposase
VIAMPLKPEPDLTVPANTLQVAKAVFTKGNPYLTLHNELGPIFEDADFAELFSKVGQSAIPPWRLALVTIMQFRETLSDQQAAEAVRSRIDWKYLLRLELNDSGFHYSVLNQFRGCLIAGNIKQQLFDKVLERSVSLKHVASNAPIPRECWARIRAMKHLEVVGEKTSVPTSMS